MSAQRTCTRALKAMESTGRCIVHAKQEVRQHGRQAGDQNGFDLKAAYGLQAW